MAKNSSLRVIDIGAIGSANVQVIGGASSVSAAHVLATTASLGAEHRVAGLTAGQVLRATGATTAAFQVLADSDLPATIVRTSRTITAGNGLTGGGDLSADRTLTVGAGLGITVNADDVALTTPGSLTATSTNSSTGSHTHAIDSTIARSAITITAGAGLTGGGDLSANRTLTVGAGTLITVNADDVALSNGSAQYQIPVTGATTFTPAWTLLSTYAGDGLAFSTNFAVELSTTSGLELTGTSPAKTLQLADSVAGNGLTVANKVLAVGAGDGVTVAADTVGLTTPGTCTVSSTNSASGSHTHAITSSSAPTGASLLASNSGGYLRLVRLGIAMDPTYALDVTGSARVSDDLYVTDALDVDGAADIYGGLTAARSGFRVLSHTGTDHAHVVINPAVGWTVDEQFDLDVGGSALVRGYIVGKHALQLSGATMICHFDGPAPHTTEFTGDPTGHMGQVATVTGGVIYRPGKFGKALQTAEATTNLIVNPSFEVALTTGWSTSGGSIVTSGGLYGASYLGNAGTYTYQSVTITNGASYTFSFWCKGSYQMNLYFGSGALNYRAGTVAVGADGWGRYTETFTATGTTFTAYLYNYSYDAVQLEQAAYATPYCDGSLGTGHTWAGTAHASASSRTNAHLQYATTLTSIYSFSAWVYFTGINPGGNNYWLFHDSGLYVGINTAGAPTVFTGTWTTGAAALSSNTWYHYVFVSTGSDQLLYINGVNVASNTADAPTPGTGNIYISLPNAPNKFNGLIDDLVVLDRALTAAEVRAIYESNAPVFAETSTWQWRAGRNLFFADAEGIWMYDASGNAMLGAYAGDGAGGGTKSWGGATLAPGDVLIGKSTSYVLWDASAAKLEISGKVTATEGAIGGWTLGATTLSSNDVILDNVGKISAGASNDIAILSGVDSTYRLWIGNATSGNAAFRVSKTGVLYGTTVNLLGDITFSELAAGPVEPTSGVAVRMYMKSDKIILQYNDGGTTRYKYLDLTGTGVTWVHSTTPP